jgi:hypothetical protein
MSHLSLSQNFLVHVPKLAVSLYTTCFSSLLSTSAFSQLTTHYNTCSNESKAVSGVAPAPSYTTIKEFSISLLKITKAVKLVN